jgi:selenocysteine lyase/cysteine desulfurase
MRTTLCMVSESLLDQRAHLLSTFRPLHVVASECEKHLCVYSLFMPHIAPPDEHISVIQALIDEHRPSPGTPALFAYTGQSNITNSKPPLAVLAHAATRGFTTLLDAAALAPTTPIDLTNTPVDAVAVSFYKMFGFPTGIGALVLAPGVGAWLREKRPWFAGGTVDVVQVPGLVVGRTAAIDEAFEVSVVLSISTNANI